MTARPSGETAYFTEQPDGFFEPNPPARGPWSVDHCHAGPVTGLVARAMERTVEDKALTRLTLDLVRPIPMAGFRVTVEIARSGRTASTTRAQVVDGDGQICATATSMHLVSSSFAQIPTAEVTPLLRADASIGPPPLPKGAHGEPSFGDFIEVAYPAGDGPGPGPKTVWMRTPPLVAGESPSPVQMLCPLADCGNGISPNATIAEMAFMNTDLTIHIHREPQSEWLASEAISHWHQSGIGMAQAIISDEKGPVATALQTLLIRPNG